MDARAPNPDAKVAPRSLQLARWKPVCPTEQEGDSAAELGEDARSCLAWGKVSPCLVLSPFVNLHPQCGQRGLASFNYRMVHLKRDLLKRSEVV